jgi:hypothetical protein
MTIIELKEINDEEKLLYYEKIDGKREMMRSRWSENLLK